MNLNTFFHFVSITIQALSTEICLLNDSLMLLPSADALSFLGQPDKLQVSKISTFTFYHSTILCYFN